MRAGTLATLAWARRTPHLQTSDALACGLAAPSAALCVRARPAHNGAAKWKSQLTAVHLGQNGAAAVRPHKSRCAWEKPIRRPKEGADYAVFVSA